MGRDFLRTGGLNARMNRFSFEIRSLEESDAEAESVKNLNPMHQIREI